jgi:FlaA1/EpsC-like NDP-sugar epimerase
MGMWSQPGQCGTGLLEATREWNGAITDERMTRFWISLEQGVRFVIRCVEQMQVEKCSFQDPSMKVT